MSVLIPHAPLMSHNAPHAMLTRIMKPHLDALHELRITVELMLGTDTKVAPYLLSSPGTLVLSTLQYGS